MRVQDRLPVVHLVGGGQAGPGTHKRPDTPVAHLTIPNDRPRNRRTDPGTGAASALSRNLHNPSTDPSSRSPRLGVSKASEGSRS